MMMALNWVDVLILAIVLASVLMGGVRGAIREMFSLVGWFAAFWVASLMSPKGEQWLTGMVSSPAFRWLVSFALIFIAGLVLVELVGNVLGYLAGKAGLKSLDRLLGALFGLLRGAFLVVVLVALAGMTPFSQEPAWKTALLVKWAQKAGQVFIQHLPAGIGSKIHI